MQTASEETQFDLRQERRDLRNRLEILSKRMRTAKSNLLVSFFSFFIANFYHFSSNLDEEFKWLTSARAQI